jgi:hypothetical protein
MTAWVLVRDDGRLYGGDQWVTELHMAATFAAAHEVHDVIRERKPDASTMFSDRRLYSAKVVGIDDDGRLKESAFV